MVRESEEICKIDLQLASGMIGINFLVLTFLVGYIEKNMLLEIMACLIIMSSVAFFTSIFYYHRAFVIVGKKEKKNDEDGALLIRKGDKFINIGFLLVFSFIPLLMYSNRFKIAIIISIAGVIFILFNIQKIFGGGLY